MSDVLTAVREKYPVYKDVPDEQLVSALGDKYPVYLKQDPQFFVEYQRSKGQIMRQPESGGLAGEMTVPDPRAKQTPQLLTPGPAALDAGQVPGQQERVVQAAQTEQAQRAKEFASGPVEIQSESITTPKLTKEDLTTLGVSESVAKPIAGLQQAMTGLTDFFLSPWGVATMGTGGLGAGAQKALAGAWIADMARQAPGQVSRAYEAFKSGDTETGTRELSGAVLGSLLGAHGVHEALKPAAVRVAQALDAASKGVPEAKAAIDAAARQVISVRDSAGEVQQPTPHETLLPRSAAAVEALNKGETPNEAQIQNQNAQETVPQESQGVKNVPQEEVLTEKPAPVAPEQAPQEAAPTETAVTVADAAGAGTPAESQAISQSTPEASAAQPAATGEAKPEAAGPGIVGMGGAVSEEFGPTGVRATANKNAVIDAEAVARGGQPQLAPMRRSNEQVFDKAMAEIERNPELPDQLVQELLKEPRVLLDWEHLAVLRRRVELRYEFEKAAREAAQAYDDLQAANSTGNTQAAEARSEALASARQRSDFWSSKLGEMDTALGKGGAGTEAGRALAIRRTMMNEDFSLASLEIQKRAANDFRPLTDAERAELIKTADQYKALNDQLKTDLAQKDQKLAESEAKRSLAEIEAANAKTKRASDYVLKTAEKWVAKWGKEAETARKNLAGKFLSPSPKDLLDLAKIVRFRIGELGLDVAKITAELVSDFGEGVKPYIEGAIKTAQEMIDKLGESVPKATRQAVKDAATKAGPTVGSVQDKIAGKVAKGDSGITPQVKKLAEMFYEQGIKELNPMIDALHSELKKSIPDITRQETMDSLSGRGRFWQASQDEIKKGVRDLSTQARLVAHQIDVEAGKPLPRTGYQPDKMSDAARREQAKLEELKRRLGVNVTDPAAQLATALQSAKTYLRNSMADLQEEIRTREKIVKTRTPLKPDAELEAMRKEYAAVKAEHEAVFPRGPLTDEQRIAAANRALDRAIQNLETDLAQGKLFHVETKAPKLSRPELEAKRARLEALKDQRQELRDLDPALQQEKARAAIESQQKALQKQIDEQERRLREGDLAAPGQPMNRPAIPELEEMKQKRDALTQQLAEARKKPEAQKAAEQLTRQVEAANKRVAELEKKVAAGDTSTRKAPVNRPLPPELEQARQKMDALNKQLAELRKGPAKSPLERALQSRKTRLTNQIAEMQEKISKGDYGSKPKRTPPSDPEIVRKQYQLEQLRQKFHEGLIADKMARRSTTRKVFDAALESVNATRAIMTSMDLSAVLRQGKMMVLAHPIRAAKSIMPMLRAFRSPEAQLAVEQEILARPNYPLYRRSRLFLSEHGQKLSQMEEAYMSRWVKKLPLVAASERAYTTFLNKLRADSFDAMAKTLGRGGEVSPKEAEIIANYINKSTGRGSIGLNDQAAVGLNTAFFAPRYVASRFQMLMGQPIWHGALSGKAGFAGTGRARALVASEYGRILGGMAVVYSLGLAAGAKLETDPRSTDFGKLKWGNTRIDPMAGLIQVSVLLSRLASGSIKTARGKVNPIRGPHMPYKGTTGVDLIGRFARTKLAPVPGATLDLIQGKDFSGQPISPGSIALDLITPMSVNDIYKSMKEQGIPAGTALGILSIFGESVQNYDALKPRPRNQ